MMPEKFKQLDYRFRTKLACEIVEYDPLRLNESIAAKDGYKCAPETSPGVAREFGEFDLVALFVFRMLTSKGFSQSLASTYACSILSGLSSNYLTLPDRFDCPMTFPGDRIGCQSNDPTMFIVGDNTVAYATISFNIPALREEIRARMEHIATRERNTFGSEE